MSKFLPRASMIAKGIFVIKSFTSKGLWFEVEASSHLLLLGPWPRQVWNSETPVSLFGATVSEENKAVQNRMVQEVKKQFFRPIPGVSANGVALCHAVTPCVYCSLVLRLVLERFHAHHGNYLQLEDVTYSSSRLNLFSLSVLWSSSHPSSYSLCHNVAFSSKFRGIPFRIDSEVPQLFMALSI
jgi:hypothetical protein